MDFDLEHGGSVGPVDYHLQIWPVKYEGPGLDDYTPACDMYLIGKLMKDWGGELDSDGRTLMGKLLSMEYKFGGDVVKDVWFFQINS